MWGGGCLPVGSPYFPQNVKDTSALYFMRGNWSKRCLDNVQGGGVAIIIITPAGLSH